MLTLVRRGWLTLTRRRWYTMPVFCTMPEAYGFEKWSLDHLPIMPNPFKLQVTNQPHIQKQFNVVKTLFQLSRQIIVATDAGREGELIYRYIHQLVQPPKHVPIKRLWVSDMTETTIKKGLAELRPIAEFDRLYHAAKARSEADWLVGINFTQGYTLASKKSKALSIGRVQTATLRLIVDRFKENKEFKPSPFYVPKITLEDSSVPFELLCEHKFKDRGEAQKIVEGQQGKTSPEIVREDKTNNEAPPLPYDLTTLQRTANKVYKYTAQQTLDVVQALYEKHKALTYPRTDSQYLATNQKEDVSKIFKGLQNFKIQAVQTQDLQAECIANIAENPVFNNGKITDHHAIIPTGTAIDLDSLNEAERNIFLMVVQRFFQSFLSPCTKANRKLFTVLNGYQFSASSNQVIKKGWRVLSLEPQKEIALPEIEMGEKRTIVETAVHEGMTKPLPLFSDSSLLGIMETAGKLVKEKSLRESLKERGLGTPATRASIIETLIKREYITRKSAKLIPTQIGTALIDSIRELSICSPELTGEWEYKLKQLERNEIRYEDFIGQIREFVKTTFPEVVESAKKIADIQTPEEKARNLSLGKCPKCQAGEVRKGKKSYYCSNWNQDPKCDFTIWITSFNKRLNDTIVKALIVKGTTKKLKGFKSKGGKTYQAKLMLDENKKLKLSFE
ncbi:DNA topoisomerase [Flagellimonas sp. C4]|uniref:type IA DNA topoisomerase n=1 Tax=Flagellimonas alginolytica TaxID=3177515 RepID=UPI0035C8CC9E